jgi:aminoglycoside 6-adenylyltransferase
MRRDADMLKLILDTARQDGRIRAVVLNGSRANPQAQRDIFQDFDITYLVTETAFFKHNLGWLNRFGERMILQMPDNSGWPGYEDSFTYLVQFLDGHRIDMTILPVSQTWLIGEDSLHQILLDKDGLLPKLLPPSERDYLPQPPTAESFARSCNEFWWVSTYIAKGLWREQAIYAHYLLERILRAELLQMLTWYLGWQTDFAVNLGQYGKYFERYLEPSLWAQLQKTYAPAEYTAMWTALFAMTDLFRRVARPLAEAFELDYPYQDDERVSVHLAHIHRLPKDAVAIYA